MQTVATMNVLPACAAIGVKLPAAKHVSRSSVVARGVEPDQTETPETAMSCESQSCDHILPTSLHRSEQRAGVRVLMATCRTVSCT